MSGRTDVALFPEQLRRVQLRVAEQAHGDAGTCHELLAMLGLLPGTETSTMVCRGCQRPMMASLLPGTPPEGWARQQAGNQCVRCYRRQRAELAAAAVEAAVEPEPVKPQVVEPQIAVKTVRRRSGCRATDLGFQTRVAELRAVQGRTWPQIAAELGCAAGTARSAYSHVRIEAVAR